jgi:pimeloyl-ACP methyl ester carboxylesterase
MVKVPRDAAVAMIRAVEHDALNRQLLEVPYQQVEGTSHWLHMDKPGEFNRILDGFLAAVDLR